MSIGDILGCGQSNSLIFAGNKPDNLSHCCGRCFGDEFLDFGGNFWSAAWIAAFPRFEFHLL